MDIDHRQSLYFHWFPLGFSFQGVWCYEGERRQDHEGKGGRLVKGGIRAMVHSSLHLFLILMERRKFARYLTTGWRFLLCFLPRVFQHGVWVF